MRFLILCFLLAPWSSVLFSQTTWSEHIAPIMYQHCTSCHRDGGIAPFSLMTYPEASVAAFAVADAVTEGAMPPWPPDTTYRRFSHERVLNADEIDLIVAWLAESTPEGDPALAPPPPVYSDDGFISLPPDLEIVMPVHTSQATMMSDDYSCFAITAGLLQDKKIRAFELVPGNPAIVHHALVFIDPNASYPTNTSGNCMGPQDGLIGGYTPGAVPTVFPSDGEEFNLGVNLPAGSNVVLAMHYPHGSQGQTDQSRLRLWFYPDEVPIREVTTTPVLQNWSFTLPPNEMTMVSAQFSTIPVDISLLSVFPHMHMLGKSIESHAVTPTNLTIPLIRINHWDFHWQQFYAFEQLVRIPAWSTLFGEGMYDNTVNNPHNPNNPPITVGPGLNTSDEMFLIYFQYLPYQQGDELIDLEPLTQMPVVTSVKEYTADSPMRLFPNPARDFVNLELDIQQSDMVSVYLYDLQGRIVDRVLERQLLPAGAQQIVYSIGDELTPGMYVFSINVGGAMSSARLVVH